MLRKTVDIGCESLYTYNLTKREMTMNYDLEKSIHELMNAIKADYYRYTSRNGAKPLTKFDLERIDEFNAKVRFEEGRKYIKVITGGSVWGFVVKDGDAKFSPGTILKAASWAAPARNHARGNTLHQDWSWVQWTGPAYC